MLGHTKESHHVTRRLQRANDDAFHHPAEKIAQLKKFDFINGEILEVFAGQGNLTKYYNTKGRVTAMTPAKFGSSFDAIHRLRADKRTFDVIDIDSYGYPDKFFPVVFELMKREAHLIFTFPIVGVNCLNGIVEQHFINFWRSARPTIGDITGVLTDMALREWRVLSLVEAQKIKRIWRLVYRCTRTKATDFTTTKNR